MVNWQCLMWLEKKSKGVPQGAIAGPPEFNHFHEWSIISFNMQTY